MSRLYVSHEILIGSLRADEGLVVEAHEHTRRLAPLDEVEYRLVVDERDAVVRDLLGDVERLLLLEGMQAEELLELLVGKVDAQLRGERR